MLHSKDGPVILFNTILIELQKNKRGMELIEIDDLNRYTGRNSTALRISLSYDDDIIGIITFLILIITTQ